MLRYPDPTSRRQHNTIVYTHTHTHNAESHVCHTRAARPCPPLFESEHQFLFKWAIIRK